MVFSLLAGWVTLSLHPGLLVFLGCSAAPVSPELLMAGAVGHSNAQVLLMVASTAYCPSQMWKEDASTC